MRHVHTLFDSIDKKRPAFLQESRRDQEEGGELDCQASPGEIKSREVELGSESWTSFASVAPQQLCYERCPCDCSAQQLRSTLVAAQRRGPH